MGFATLQPSYTVGAVSNRDYMSGRATVAVGNRSHRVCFPSGGVLSTRPAAFPSFKLGKFPTGTVKYRPFRIRIKVFGLKMPKPNLWKQAYEPAIG
jgi:hypothetical protein